MNIVKLSERIARIEAEVGDKADERLTEFERGFLANLKRLRFGSDGQRIVLERIEKKVFSATT